MANGDRFEDEHIRLGGIDDYDEPPAEPTKIQFDGLKIATSKAERRRRRRRRRNGQNQNQNSRRDGAVIAVMIKETNGLQNMHLKEKWKTIRFPNY